MVDDNRAVVIEEQIHPMEKITGRLLSTRLTYDIRLTPYSKVYYMYTNNNCRDSMVYTMVMVTIPPHVSMFYNVSRLLVMATGFLYA